VIGVACAVTDAYDRGVVDGAVATEGDARGVARVTAWCGRDSRVACGAVRASSLFDGQCCSRRERTLDGTPACP
jgi:hypothetical protein